MDHDAIAVIDFGGQYAHLIATRIRRQGVLAEIRQPEDPIEAFEGYRGIIISGSPSLASLGEDSDYTKQIYDLDVPILGLCFGHQEIAKHYGGTVIHSGRQWGKADLHLNSPHPLFAGLDTVQRVWMSHYDSVVEVGEDFVELGYSRSADGAPDHRFAAIGCDARRRYGLQFHAEVDGTTNGARMLRNFALEICGCRASWSMAGYVDEQIEAIREQVGDQSVFLLASGGIDSTVATVLLGRAIGSDRLSLLHIDNGLMRKNESRQVLALFADLGLDDNLHFVDASQRFLAALEGVVEPERKRRIIGDTFIDVFQSEARGLGIENHLLAQGTIYPDTIETGGTRRSDTIKTHHNRVPLIEEMIVQGKVVEPLADLYKVEVRELGEQLGLPPEVVRRHPFPGPGLGVRLICSAGEDDPGESAEHLDELDEVARARGLQALVLPIRSVGVKADLRAYEHAVLLTGAASWPGLLDSMGIITAEIPGLNRCAWNLAPATPVGARTLAATTTPERLELLREADDRVMRALVRHGVYDRIWQCPTVLVPVELDYGDSPEAPGEGELVIVRPVRSRRAMTAQAVELPPALVDDLRSEILALDGVSGLALDLTSKPPGTIEWE